MTQQEQIFRKEAWDKAIQSFGKSYIFSQRTVFYNNWIRFLTILGIIVPVFIGATASGYGIDSDILKWTINISIPLTILQLVISVFSIVNRWSENLSYSIEATNDYANLSEEFKKLGKNPPSDLKLLEHKIDILNTKYNLRNDQDSKFQIKELERRKGMRYALREFQRTCIGCKEVPLSLESTDCEVCGNYEKSLINKLLFNG